MLYNVHHPSFPWFHGHFAMLLSPRVGRGPSPAVCSGTFSGRPQVSLEMIGISVRLVRFFLGRSPADHRGPPGTTWGFPWPWGDPQLAGSWISGKIPRNGWWLGVSPILGNLQPMWLGSQPAAVHLLCASFSLKIGNTLQNGGTSFRHHYHVQFSLHSLKENRRAMWMSLTGQACTGWSNCPRMMQALWADMALLHNFHPFNLRWMQSSERFGVDKVSRWSGFLVKGNSAKDDSNLNQTTLWQAHKTVIIRDSVFFWHQKTGPTITRRRNTEEVTKEPSQKFVEKIGITLQLSPASCFLPP